MEKKNKKIWIIGGLVLCLVAVIGITFAFFSTGGTQETANTFTSGCVKIIFSNEGSAINLQNAYPILDEEGKELEPFSFTIENTCTLFTKYTLTLEVLDDSTLNANYVATMLDTNEIQTLGSLERAEVSSSNFKEAYVLTTGYLGEGESVDYALRLWLDEDVTIDDDAMNKYFASKVVVTAEQGEYSPIDYGFNTLHDAILANEYQVTELQNSIDKINAKITPNFNKTAPIIEWLSVNAAINSNFSVVMPDPADVGSGKDYATNLTESNVYVGLAKDYTFNSDTGYYHLSNFIYQDPTTINFDNDNYYYCSTSVSTGSGRLIIYNAQSCITMYRINDFIEVTESTITGNADTTYPGLRYRLQYDQKYSQEEFTSDKSDKGLYTTEDDYGTSYYYRGSVKNNYVYFAGLYWRIIRINGDGSIRLIYAGKTKDAIGMETAIGTSAYNSVRNLPLYVGYMYGDINGTTLEEVNDNINSSTIKIALDNWYSSNLSNYTNYIADTGFCNDRTLSNMENNGNGLDTTTSTYYSAYDRYFTNQTPTLKCSNAANDLFTVSNNNGNSALTYPVGLITVDELILGGYRNGYINRLSYLYTGITSWTMSPLYYSLHSLGSTNFTISYSGITGASHLVSGVNYIRPVINLRGDVQISGGNGSQNNPFVIS